MAELDRVFNTIDAHFACYGNMTKHREPMQKLSDILVATAMGAYARLISLEREDKKIKSKKVVDAINSAMLAVRTLDGAVKSGDGTVVMAEVFKAEGYSDKDIKKRGAKLNPFPGQTNLVNASNFKEAARLAMVARRALYPLNGEQPWSAPKDAELALRDDDDAYSFSIFDSIVDPLMDMLPPLYQLSVESWVPSEEEEASATCSFCKASPGEPCKTATGGKAKKKHSERA